MRKAPESQYRKLHEKIIIEAHAWITKNCACIAWLEEGLLDWCRQHRSHDYQEYVYLDGELDRLIEARVDFEQFEAAARAWARVYCRIARAAHYAMIAELNRELKAALEAERPALVA